MTPKAEGESRERVRVSVRSHTCAAGTGKYSPAHCCKDQGLGKHKQGGKQRGVQALKCVIVPFSVATKGDGMNGVTLLEAPWNCWKWWVNISSPVSSSKKSTTSGNTVLGLAVWWAEIKSPGGESRQSSPWQVCAKTTGLDWPEVMETRQECNKNWSC